jgi:putative transcriptional regulator
MSFGKGLIKSANEALSIAKGDIEPVDVFVPQNIDIVAIRKHQKLSQADFAQRYGLSLGTVRDWEQKRRKPDRAALILLSVIEKNPDAVIDALSA